MSKINILRAVENIRSRTTVYTPVVEIIVNAVQATADKNSSDGQIEIFVERSSQEELDHGTPAVDSIFIKDNGVGFTEENRESFDTLFSDHRILQGGKGFGRFTYLKYFEDLIVKSVFKGGQRYRSREFNMGKGNDIIVNEKISDSDERNTGTTVKLSKIKDGKFIDKMLPTIARVLTERLLPYFIDSRYTPPDISISEADGSGKIILNEFFTNQLADSIQEIDVSDNNFILKDGDNEHKFKVRVFKFYSPKSHRSKVSLVAHRREVTDTPIQKYVPEFADEFFEKKTNGSENRERNYIIKAYILSDYLDENVSLERGGFEFGLRSDMLTPVAQEDIERKAAEIARMAVGDEITMRQEKKRLWVQEYVDNDAPWHKSLLKSIDLSNISYRPSSEEMELSFQKEKFRIEADISKKVDRILEDKDIGILKENITEIVQQISESSKNDLMHYVVFRRKVLELFGRKLELDPDGRYSSEGAVHDIIFPRRKNTDSTPFEEHNLWIIDERLNFTSFVCSDRPLNDGNTGRPDLVAFNRRVLFRGNNEASNPVSIFEFKRPQRDDFVNPSAADDPIQQIIRYVKGIRNGNFKTQKGRSIQVLDNTPIYGYVVCDLSKSVEDWLEFDKNFKPMPDKMGWFQWHGNMNLHLEVISWDKILQDAEMRNKIFFRKLGIN